MIKLSQWFRCSNSKMSLSPLFGQKIVAISDCDFSRDCYFSYWSNSLYFIEDRYGSGISFYLTKFLRLDYNFNYGEASYPELMLLQMPDGQYEEIKRKDTYHIHTAGFVVRIIRNTGIGLMFNFWERESNYFWENRNREFIGGYVTYEF